MDKAQRASRLLFTLMRNKYDPIMTFVQSHQISESTVTICSLLFLCLKYPTRKDFPTFSGGSSLRIGLISTLAHTSVPIFIKAKTVYASFFEGSISIIFPLGASRTFVSDGKIFPNLPTASTDLTSGFSFNLSQAFFRPS